MPVRYTGGRVAERVRNGHDRLAVDPSYCAEIGRRWAPTRSQTRPNARD